MKKEKIINVNACKMVKKALMDMSEIDLKRRTLLVKAVNVACKRQIKKAK